MTPGDYLKTPELVEELLDENVTIEASYNLGQIRFTHVIHVKDGIVYDEGIDNEVSECTPEEFLCLYRNLTWYVWNTIHNHEKGSRNKIDEPMDGDEGPALASAGFGTDEDYDVYESEDV